MNCSTCKSGSLQPHSLPIEMEEWAICLGKCDNPDCEEINCEYKKEIPARILNKIVDDFQKEGTPLKVLLDNKECHLIRDEDGHIKALASN